MEGAQLTSAVRESILRAMGGPSATIWRRRVLLMLVVGFLVAIPVTLIARDSGDEPTSPSATTTPSLDEQFPLNAGVRDTGLGARYQVPKGWKEAKKASVVRLLSPDKSVQIGISAPGPASDSGQILSTALVDLKGTYEHVDLAKGSGKRIGGLESKGAVVTARTKSGTELHVLVAAAAGKRLTHLIEVFTAAGAPVQRVAEAQRALDSLRFTN
jgi:hypothetical protein